MKKLLAIVLCLSIMVLFAGCSGFGNRGAVDEFEAPENYTLAVTEPM